MISMKKNCLIWLALLALGGNAAAEDHEMFWFKNEMQCGAAKVTVRSLCEERDHTGAVVPYNNQCLEQELRIEQPGAKPVKRDLLERETSKDTFRIATALRCTEAGGKQYLHVMIDNGGNCDECETSAVLDLQGHWKRYGKRWLSTPPAERKTMSQQGAKWFQQDPFFLRNITRD